MMWRCYICDTMTGKIVAPIDIPKFSWSLSVSDSSFSTVKDKGVGEDDLSGITLPWSAVPAGTPEGREDMLASGRRALAVMWADPDGDEYPILFGAIGDRKDTWEDTSFDIQSVLELLSERVFCYEGTFGTGRMWAEDADYDAEGEQPGELASVTTADAFYDGWSLRGIASDMGVWCTDRKPGGTLPVDWSYTGERGGHQRTYYGHNASNNSYSKLLEELTNVSDGIDAQFRPYRADATHVRVRFVAGSDADRFLPQAEAHSLTAFPGGGTLDGLEIAYAKPRERVYATGAGQDRGQLCHLSEDRSLLEQRDPWPLAEDTVSDSSWTNAGLVARHADARLALVKEPVCQLTGTIDALDPFAPRLGRIWPGESVSVTVRGHPSFPDGTYDLRLMEMSGDQTSTVKLTFDVMANPWYVRR